MSIVVKGKDVTTPAVKAAIAKFEAGMAAHRELLPGEAVTIDVNPDRTVATLEFEIAGNGTDVEVRATRSTCVRSDAGARRRSVRSPGVEAYADGRTAQDHDFNDTLKSHLRIVIRVRPRRRRSCCCWSRSARSSCRSRRSP